MEISPSSDAYTYVPIVTSPSNVSRTRTVGNTASEHESDQIVDQIEAGRGKRSRTHSNKKQYNSEKKRDE